MSLPEAIATLQEAGAVFSLPATNGALRLARAAQRLDVSVDWMHDHLDEFPNWFRLPAGSGRGRAQGELRIPMSDLVAFEKRRQKARGAHE